MKLSKLVTVERQYDDFHFGSANGYEYRYRVWSDEDIIHRYSRLGIREDVKFLIEIRAIFRVRVESEDDDDGMIDLERFEIGAKSCDNILYSFKLSQRLEDYWLSFGEREALGKHVSDFAAGLQVQGEGVIPIAVDLDICSLGVSVGWESKSMGEAKERAMRCEKLLPLWAVEYERNALVNVERPPYGDLVPYLSCKLQLLRVLYPHLFKECKLWGGASVGDEYAILDVYCDHEFHYLCLVRALLTTHTSTISCPVCSHPIPPPPPAMLRSIHEV